MAQDRHVDVIVPVSPDGPAIIDRLRRILDCSGPPLGRLLVVHEGSPGHELDNLAGLDARVVLLACEPGLSWAGRMACGLAERQGDAVVLSPGARPTVGWLGPLADAAHAAERVALVAPLSDGDGFDRLEGIEEDSVAGAVASLPVAIEVHRSGVAANYLRGDLLDAVGTLDAEIESPREAMDDWLARAFALGFFARRSCRSVVFLDAPGAVGDAPASPACDIMRRRFERAEKAFDASLARHAVEVATTGRIKVALDLRHLPLEMNGTKMYALSLGKALAKLPEVELSMLALHPLQAEGVEGRLVHPDDWADDVHVIHKPAQVFDPAHAELLFRSRAHIAVTHQDLIAYRMAEAFGDEAIFEAHRQTTRLVLPAMQAILTPSGVTGDEVRFEFAGVVDPDAVHPVHEGGDLEEFGDPAYEPEADEILARLGVSGPFFMAMASDYPHKNMPALLDAYARLRELRGESPTPSLVLPGRAPRTRAAASERPGGLTTGVTFLGGVSHQELRILYQNAIALVFPSLYEGFGLPPLESMAAGTPVVAMPFTSVHEVCRNAALFAEGLAPSDLARAMQRLADEPELRRELRRAGHRRVRELNWEKAARETVAVYRRMIFSPAERSLQSRRSLTEAIVLWATPQVAPPAEVAVPVAPERAPEPFYTPSAPEPDPEPMGVINACQALRQAVRIRIRRDLARVAPTQYARLVCAKRLTGRFIQIVRTDGLGAAAEKAARKARVKARNVLRKVLPAGLIAGRPCFYFELPEPLAPYDAWLAANAPSPRRAARLAEEIAALGIRPKFSILTPVFNTPPALLDAAVRSVLAQSYVDWELILADDGSTDPATVAILGGTAWGDDSRIRVVRRSANGGISAATNTAAEHATGDWLVLLDHDDLLHPEALARLAIGLDRDPEADLAYSDDDKTDLAGNRVAPQFKPDWSPELLLSFCYTGHLSAVRTALYREVGGMRTGFEGSQDHDFWLRASEKARRIVHLPHVLYHWRVVPGSTAADGREKPHSFEAGRLAVEEAFSRRGVPCRVDRPDWAVAAGCGIYRPAMPDDGPSVAVLIVGSDRQMLGRTLASLWKTIYRNHRVYIVDTSATPSLGDFSPHTTLRLPGLDSDAGRAETLNRAAALVEEEYVLFLEEGVEAADSQWLSQMVGWLRLVGVGAVGARLLDGDRRIRDAGIVHGMNEGLPGNAYEQSPRWDGGPMNLPRVTRNVLAASSACLLTPRNLFLSLGGFDAENFEAAHADADYGGRLHDAGHRCVVCAEAVLIARGEGPPPPHDTSRADAAYRRIHGRRRDPYVSPHHDPLSANFAIQATVVAVSASRSPVRLAAFTHNLNWEGASRFELELTTGLKRIGAVDPVVFSPIDGPLRMEYEKAGVQVCIDPTLAAIDRGEAAYVEARAATVEMLRREGFEVVHGNTLQGFWAVDAAREAGVPSIWSLHESEDWATCFDHLPREVARAALDGFESPYRVVFTARNTAGLWKPLDTGGNFGLVRYALNVDRFRDELATSPRSASREALGIADDEVCVLLLGTVCERKGQHDLVLAFRELAPDVAARMQCLVVGARDSLDYSREFKRLASELPDDRRGRFRIVDETGATAAYWQAADVFCCTSRVESYPHVVLEALGRGLPIVTTPVHGIPEQVRRDVNAALYGPGDYRLLAQALESLVVDPARRAAMGEASSRILQALPDHAEMVGQYARLVREAAESAPPIGARQAASALYRGVHFSGVPARSLEPSRI